MNNKINKKFFIFSFLLHILVVLIFSFFTTDNAIVKRFVVFGLHSKKPTHAYFRALKAPATSSNKWLSQRNLVQKKTIQPKKEIKKTEPKVQEKKVPQKNLKREEKKPPPKTTVNKKPEKKEFFKAKPITPPQKKQEGKIEEKEDLSQKTNKEEDQFHFNLMGEADPNLVMYQKHIQKEVERLWRPPIGVPKGTECTLCFTINSKGEVEHFELIKESKVLIYNLSISHVAKKFKFDKSLWNKKFTIDFRQ